MMTCGCEPASGGRGVSSGEQRGFIRVPASKGLWGITVWLPLWLLHLNHQKSQIMICSVYARSGRQQTTPSCRAPVWPQSHLRLHHHHLPLQSLQAVAAPSSWYLWGEEMNTNLQAFSFTPSQNYIPVLSLRGTQTAQLVSQTCFLIIILLYFIKQSGIIWITVEIIQSTLG